MKRFLGEVFRLVLSIIGIACVLFNVLPLVAKAQMCLTMESGIELDSNAEEHDWKVSLNETETLSEDQRVQLSALVQEHDVIDMDISSERILLYLSANDHLFLRLACWNDMLNQYLTYDTEPLPAGSYLDVYHDGDSVLLALPFAKDDMTVEDPEDYDWLYLTFSSLGNDWYLTSFTDGQTFVASLGNESYLFDDYYEPAAKYTWESDCMFSFEGFKADALIRYIDEYNSTIHNRPSLQESNE